MMVDNFNVNVFSSSFAPVFSLGFKTSPIIFSDSFLNFRIKTRQKRSQNRFCFAAIWKRGSASNQINSQPFQNDRSNKKLPSDPPPKFPDFQKECLPKTQVEQDELVEKQTIAHVGQASGSSCSSACMSLACHDHHYKKDKRQVSTTLCASSRCFDNALLNNKPSQRAPGFQ